MLHRFRHVFLIVSLLLVASCSGGGCGGCAGGTPLPGGFPTDKAVENAASVRLSRPGLDFLEKELGPIAASALGAKNGIMQIGIPESPINASGLSGKICPGGPDPAATPPKCEVSVNLAGSTFMIDAVTPSAIDIAATIPVELDDTPVSVDVGASLTIHIGYGANGTCNGSGSVSVDPKPLPVKISLPLVADTTAPRTGYTKIDVDDAVIDLSAISSDDVTVCANCGLFTSICNGALGLIKGTLVDQLKKGLDSQVKGMLRDQLCTKPSPAVVPSCPTGTSPGADKKFCVYDADPTKCVPTLLGADGHMDLGTLLRAFSPSTTGAVDFGLAAFGPMKPAPGLPAEGGRTPNGVTLSFAGGVLPQPTSNCIAPKEISPPKDVPIPDELAPAAADPAATPHVGLALSGRFLDYALTNAYNSGLLCLGISTEQVDMLKTGLLSFLIPSLKTITFEQGDAAAAIVTRPGAPPTAKLGGGTDVKTDPLLLVTLPRLSLDFYIWSFDRFARVFTYTGDLTIPVNLQTAKGPNDANGALVPQLGELKVENGSVSNADVILLDDPTIVAGAVSSIFGTVSQQLVGNGLAPIDLSSALASFGMDLQIDQIKKLTKGNDDFLGVFATLAKKAGTALPESDTRATLVGKRVWKDHLQASTYDHAKLPELELELASSLEGTRPVEYAWWIDSGTRSPWTAAKHVVIKDDQLFVQGRHVVHVASRVVGEPATEDATPADVPYVIDAVAPVVRIERADGEAVALHAWDLVSKPDALVGRYRLDGSAPSDWRPLAALARIDVGAAGSVEVEVKDEEGNVGVVRQALRGVADPTLVAAGSSCGCSAPGATDPGGALALVLGASALALVVLRRRGALAGRAATRGAVALGAIGVVAATSQGCACGDAADTTGCGSDCNQKCETGLEKGQPGAYLSVAKAKDGTLWMAGYNDSLLAESDALLWGDLVVGKYDAAKQQVEWRTVDGLPERTDGTCPTYEPDGWRKGETDSGDDVGRYTSIQLSAKDQPIVSYYDDTHHRLKLAVFDGGWNVFVLKEQAGADIGKYSKMLVVDGKPIVAYMHLEPGNTGRTRAKIVLARSRVETPRGPGDFDFQDVAVDDEGPCRATSCEAGEACIKETGVCTKTASGCAPACADGSACVTKDSKATCRAKASSIETYPRGVGPYISLAKGPSGLGIVAYDGYHGNLLAFIDRGSSWERVILDGETGNRADQSAVDTGDVGIAASLAIGPSGTWHVSYVNGSDETLRYISMTDGKPGKSEVVDDGSGVDGQPFPDGKHVVGDDSTIRADGDAITIYYADSSSLGLRRAVGTGGSNGHEWALRAVKQDNRWVAFPQFVPDEDKVAAWWRQSTRATKTVVGDVIVISP
jgi:hypothetical protein